MRPQYVYIATLVCLTSLSAVTPASAQHSAFAPYLGVGSLTTIKDLNIAGTEFLSGGLYLEGGVNWQAWSDQPGLLVQGDVMWNKQTFHTPKAGSGTKLDMVFLGLNLDYSFVNKGRFALALAGGGGPVALHIADTTGTSVVKFFARLGLGVHYQASRRLKLTLQGFGLVYDLGGFPSTSVLGPVSYTHLTLPTKRIV